MFNNWKLLCAGKVAEVDSKFAFPHLRWMSGNVKNLPACVEINKVFFKVPAKVVVSLLHANCKGGFFKYPKAVKEELSAKEQLLKDKIMEYYHWGSSEFEKNKSVISNISLDELNKHFGFDKKECKILGVEYAERKYKFTTDKPKSSKLDAFM